MITLNQFTMNMWYITKIIVMDYNEKMPDNPTIDNLKSKALFSGSQNKLESVTFKSLSNLYVKSYGVIDDYLIIEVLR